MANVSPRVNVSLLLLTGLPLIVLGCSSSNGTEGDNSATGGGFSLGGETSTGSSSAIGTGCAQQSVPISALPPDILIVQDRSQSMTDDSNDKPCSGGTCGANSKWSQVTTAITAVATASSSVNWGLFYFGNGATLCGVNTTPAVPISANGAAQIVSSLSANLPGGATPTAATINNAVAYMKTLNDQNPKYLLLATDGEPNCVNGDSSITDSAGATTAIANAKSAGFPTFVVGIGNVASATTALNAMANAGGEPQAGATAYYAVADTAGLEAALTQIVGMVASCTISLENTPQGDWTIAIWVTDSSGKTIQLPSSASDGWAYNDTSRSTITLLGPTCDKLKNGTYSNLQFVYTCQNQTIMPPIN